MRFAAAHGDEQIASSAAYLLAEILHERGNDWGAGLLLAQAATSADDDVRSATASLLKQVRGLPRQELKDSDPSQARQWYERAAQAGHADAMNNLRVLLEDSDPSKAQEWWQHAAQAGNANAMVSLGVRLYGSDPGQAQEWWQRAAQDGHTGAMFNLGLVLKDCDPAQAQEWWQRAALAGHADAVVWPEADRESDPARALVNQSDITGHRPYFSWQDAIIHRNSDGPRQALLAYLAVE